MIDPTKYRFDPEHPPVVEEVEDEDVIYQGTPLNAERIQEIVDRVDRTTNLRPGGKSLSGDGSHSPVLRTRVSKATAESIQALAAEAGVSTSKYLRGLIERELAAHAA